MNDENGNDSYPEIRRLEFIEEDVIDGLGPNLIWIAGHTRNENEELEEIILIPNKWSPTPKKGRAYLVSMPRKYLPIAAYYNNWRRYRVFAVKIIPVEILIEVETGKEIEIFDNIFIPKNLLKVSNENIAKILIRKPDEKYENYLVLMKIEDENIRDLFQAFFEKNSGYHKVKSLNEEDNDDNPNNPLLEIIINGEMKVEEVKELVMVPFHKYFNLKSEA